MEQSKQQFTCADWQVTVHYDGSTPQGPDWLRELPSLLTRFENPDAVIKHDHRGLIGTVEIDNVRYAVKQFILQRTWFWFQLTSIVAPSLGEVAFRNAIRLREDGILTPEPVLLLQRRIGKLVTDSWLIYKYVDGDKLTRDDSVEIVAFVRNMHKHGWVHRDPHPGNFIRGEAGITTIDPIRARKNSHPYFQAYDVVLMSHDLSEATELYGLKELGRWYDAAVKGHEQLRRYRQLKQDTRRFLGMSNRL